jgi:hypothetical protein
LFFAGDNELNNAGDIMKPQSPRQVVRFVASCDAKLPEDQQTVFLIKPLTVEEQDMLEDAYRVTDESGMVVRSSFATQLTEAVHLGLSSIEGAGEFPAIERETVPDKFGVYRIKSEILELIPRKIRQEIGLRVIEMLKPSEDERKN